MHLVPHAPPIRPLALALFALLAALLALLAFSHAPAQAQTDPCSAQEDALTKARAMNTAFGGQHLSYLVDRARNDLQDCRDRVKAAEQQRLASERSRAGNAYADAEVFSQERSDALDAWNEADRQIDDDGTPYNDGLSDFERYYCVEDIDPEDDGVQTRKSRGISPGSLPERSGSESHNVTSVTCWN